jgi:hypothetical protein
MRAMFYADGDGMGLEEVDAICRPLSDVVDVMQLDTGLIIQNIKQVGGRVGGLGWCLMRAVISGLVRLDAGVCRHQGSRCTFSLPPRLQLNA